MGAMVPEIYQALALILLYPLSDVWISNNTASSAKEVFFMKQTIENACGSVALLHVLANNMTTVAPGSIMETFYSDAKDQSAGQKGAALEKNDQICKLHSSFASLGQTDTPDSSNDVDLHFIAFIHGKDGNLYELDGRLEGPLDHGPIEVDQSGAFFLACSNAIQERFIGDSSSVNFTAMALVPTPSYLP
jgi:ubiquitin carboxyl-terminal hydrolase L3